MRACARHYRDSPEPLEDLIQVGYVGLLKAIQNYDPTVGSGRHHDAGPGRRLR
ncbi:MAG TPA: sigma factor [Trebonia sp.]|nr:sigma factor [Trebonia sp.]